MFSIGWLNEFDVCGSRRHFRKLFNDLETFASNIFLQTGSIFVLNLFYLKLLFYLHRQVILTL